MTDKLTDKEIIKALECCILGDCQGCFYGDTDQRHCKDNLMQNALDLINRQQAEIERLTINMNAFGLGMKREKERADTARAEAIKEFAERLKNSLKGYGGLYCRATMNVRIDNRVKEMVGEQE